MDWGASDTIVGVATAQGRGGVAILRISGKSALQKGLQLFASTDARLDAATIDSHRLYFGKFLNSQNETIDSGYLVYLRAPHTYTGEDTVELHGHGGEVAPRLLLEAALSLSEVRQAEPGEFTFRAFLNQKITLSQAEAVHEVVSSQDLLAHRLALSQLQGESQQQWNEFQSRLVTLLSQFEADLDFPDEAFATTSVSDRQQTLQTLIQQLHDWIAASAWRRRASEAVRVVLAGPTNVGKSTLFNALLGQGRAIVADQPGTTRDYLEAQLLIDGVRLVLIDTAGVERSGVSNGRKKTKLDPIEAVGISRAKRLWREADAVIWVDDPQTLGVSRLPIDQEGESQGWAPRWLHLVNKADWLGTAQTGPAAGTFDGWISAQSANDAKSSLAPVREFIADICRERCERVRSVGICVNERGETALRRCLHRLNEALDLLKRGNRDELVAEQLWEGARAMDELTGKSVAVDVVESIFQNFCIGK